MKTILFFVFLVFSASCKLAPPRNPSNETLAQVDVSKNLSQLVRSNSPHYWGWVKEQQKLYTQLPEWSQYQGFILGDAHMGNFAPYLVEQSQTSKKSMEFVAVDFDDAAHGPFIFDFIRFVIASEAIDKTIIKKSDLIEAYLWGLQNPTQDLRSFLPKEAKALLNMSPSEVLQSQIQYAEKKSSGRQFKLRKNQLMAYNGPLTNTIRERFKSLRVLDIAERVVDRGGSKEALRLWVLVERNNSKIIIELKEWKASGVNKYAPQTPPLELMPNIYSYYWPNLKPNAYQLEAFNEQLFWVRERHDMPLDVPSEASTTAEQTFLVEYAQACAKALGQAHGRQPQGQQWFNILKQKGTAGIKTSIAPVVDDYLELLRQALK